MAVSHASLSARLQGRLSSLLVRIRGFRLLRGLAITALLLTLVAGVAFAIDAAAVLSEPIRQAILLGWSGLGLLGVAITLHRLSRVPAARDLAALVEERYPELAERLTSSIELDGTAGVDPALLQRLVLETEATTAGLPFTSALPGSRTGLVTAVALLAVTGLTVPALLSPDYAKLAHRFVWPWGATELSLGYELRAGTGDQAVRRGSEVLIWATLRPLREGIELPDTVRLIAEDGSATTLLAAGDDVYTTTRTVNADLRYHLEAGAARTPSYTLRTLLPVELAPDQPVTTITPPLYASSVRDVDTLTGLVDLEGLQHGTLLMRVQFARPAEKAELQIQPREGEPTVQPFELGADGTTGEVTVLLSQSGKYRIVATSREGLTEPIPGASLTVNRDRAPEVLERDRRLPGLNRPVNLGAYEPLNLSFQAEDDIAVAAASVEFTLGGEEKLQTQGVALDKLGPTTVQGRVSLKLSPEALKSAGKLAYRLRIEDNKPKELGGPNVTYFPKDRWLEVEIGKEQPNKGTEILAQRDSINLKLNQLIDEVAREWRAANKVRQETRDLPKLEANQREQIREIEQTVRDTAREIEKLAQEYQDERGLEPLVQALEEIRRQEIEAAQQALKQAGTPERAAQPRDADLGKADQKLDAARRKLEDLRQKSNEVAQQRLDQARAEQLAREQEKLAEQARELAAKEPQTPLTKEQLAELERKQRELEQELQKLAENSPALQEAMKQLQPEIAQKLGQQAEDLARQQRELARQQDETERRPLVERLQDLARKQEELAKKQEELGRNSKPQAEAAGKPLDPKEARQAAESLKQGDAQQAAERQEKAAGELDQLAKNLERAGDLAKDPKQATEQLARMQAELKQEVAKNPGRRADHAAQQKALEDATRRLPVEKNDLVGQARKDAAAERMAEARKELEKGNIPRAQELMEMARNFLDQLARTQPSKEQREASARAEVDRLKTQQDQVAQLARQADQARTPAEREQKLAEAARKQAETAESLSKLKLPEPNDRLDRTRQASNQALRDLLDREKGKIAGSQEEAKSQLDRLVQSLRGEKPLEERVRDLAKEQRDLAKEAEALAKMAEPQKEEVERLKKKQRDLAKQAEELQTPEEQKQLEQARRSLQQAGQDQNPADFAKRTQQAAEDVDRLLRRVEKEEKPAEQAKRMADEAKDQPPGQLARELEQMRTPSEAQPEKDRARQELKKAEDAKSPAEREAAKQQAEQALRDLAKKLEQNPEKPQPQPEKSPRHLAEELAKQQRDIEKSARETQQEQAAKGAANRQNFERKMQDLLKKQQDLNRQASQLPADGQQKSLEETRQAMNRAQNSLEKKESGAAQQAGTAAQQLEKLAKSLPDRALPQQAQGEPQPQPGQQAREQAEQARQLAQEQRDLRDQVRKTLEQNQQARQEEQQKQLPDLARQQAELAKQAQDLAKQMGRDRADPHAAEKAQQAAREAAEQMQRGEAGQAEKAAEQAVEQFRKLAEEMKQAGNGEGRKQAEELARRQEQMQQKLQQTPQGQQARQEQLQQQGQDLMQQLQKLAEQMKNQPGQPATQEAARAGEQAQQAMQRAREEAKQGNAGQAQQAREEAARKFEEAGKQAQQAAREGMANRPMAGGEETTESLRQAREQTQQARQQLQKQAPGKAQNLMQQAAESMQKLAQQMLPQAQPTPMKTVGQMPEMGPQPGGLPTADALPPELAPYAGKPWGELPGELRTRILQEARGRYGEDYARMIKLYFEQLATQRRGEK